MLSLIDSIYEAVTRPQAWTEALAGVSKTLGVENISICAFNFETEANDNINLPIDPEYARTYATHWATRNLLWDASAHLPVGQPFSTEVIFPRKMFRKTEIFNEWFQPQGFEIDLSAKLLVEGPLSVVASVYRPASRPDFSPTDIAWFSHLVPHLQRAMQLRVRLASAELDKADFRAVLATLDQPALLVDRQSRILYANSRAERLIAGQVLTVAGNGSLSAWNASETSALHRLVFETLAGDGSGAGGKMVLRRPVGRAVTLLVSALHRSHSVFARSASLILIDDPEQLAANPPDIGLLRAHYQLTNTEAKLVVALLDGAKLRVAADALGITFATARVHLAHVFQKTQVNTQAELMRLLIKAGLDR